MRHDLRIRWAIVAASLLAAAWYLWPTLRLYSMSPAKREELRETDPAAWDRLKSRAIQLGLDLQGGMHLVLELDEGERTFDDEERRDATDRALEIIRNRVDQFGVSEPLIQKVGDERIIVELPGIQDQERAKELVQRTAFLEFQMAVDGRELTERLRDVDAALAGRAVAEEPAGGSAAPADTTESADTAGADSLAATVGADTTAGSAQDTAASTSLGEFLGRTEDEAGAPAAGGDNPISSLLQTEAVGGEAFNLLVDETEVERVRSLLADPAAIQAIGASHEWLWSGEPTAFADGRSYRRLYLVEKEAELSGEAIATAALSMMRLTIMSTTSGSTSTGSTATWAIFQASCSSRGSSSSER